MVVARGSGWTHWEAWGSANDGGPVILEIQVLAAPLARICAPDTQLASGDARKATTAAISAADPGTDDPGRGRGLPVRARAREDHQAASIGLARFGGNTRPDW